MRAQVRRELAIKQLNLCWHCKGRLEEPPLDKRGVNAKLFPTGFFQHPIHLHHDHKTDLCLGAVHAQCNAILWQYYHQ